MAKIVIIGAGSGFGSRLSIDILARAALADSTIALCDIHAERLEQVRDYIARVRAESRLEDEVDDDGLSQRIKEIREEARGDAARRELEELKRRLSPTVLPREEAAPDLAPAPAP